MGAGAAVPRPSLCLEQHPPAPPPLCWCRVRSPSPWHGSFCLCSSSHRRRGGHSPLVSATSPAPPRSSDRRFQGHSSSPHLAPEVNREVNVVELLSPQKQRSLSLKARSPSGAGATTPPRERERDHDGVLKPATSPSPRGVMRAGGATASPFGAAASPKVTTPLVKPIPCDEELQKMRLKDLKVMLIAHDGEAGGGLSFSRPPPPFPPTPSPPPLPPPARVSPLSIPAPSHPTPPSCTPTTHVPQPSPDPCDGCTEKAEFVRRAKELRDSPDADRARLSLVQKSRSLPPPRAGSAGRSSLTAALPRTPGRSGGGGGGGNGSGGGGSGVPSVGGGSGVATSAPAPTLTYLGFQLTLIKLAREVVGRRDRDPEETLDG